MKDSEKDKRISNLKNIMNNVKKEDSDNADEKDVYSTSEFEEFHEGKKDSVSYLFNNNEEEEIEDEDIIDDEFIFNPSKSSDATILEDESEIDEKFIIKTHDEKEDFEKIDFSEDDEDMNSLKNTFKDDEDIEDEKETEGEFPLKFLNKLYDYKITNIQIIFILGILLGILLIIISALMFFGNADRVIDNVASGENNVAGIIFLFLGIIITILSIFKAFSLKNPFGDLVSSIETLEKVEDKKEDDVPEILKEPPIDRSKYKIGEFDKDSLRPTKKSPEKDLEDEDFSKIEEAESIEIVSIDDKFNDSSDEE
ncbi:hypothetical protein [Methanobrevibacter sp. DSM 116169]|uniref:hypothetical protein n=1 Tax=Methanobrevibacter sp. DSM 116169 TaxID=3242727 RepID=UPI0038FC3C50